MTSIVLFTLREVLFKQQRGRVRVARIHSSKITTSAGPDADDIPRLRDSGFAA